ncbi:MAG: hypothetical protein LBQ60_00930 [Bacteroidales bacterium]|jgi:hypothetical protein|nr:hypothetical protein [Bacteroidales bacterium]
MRTIKKSSIDELRKIMPVLNEEEQSAYCGGTYYYTKDGTFIHSTGTSNNIAIEQVDSAGFVTYTGLSDASYADQQEFLSNLAYKTFDYSGSVSLLKNSGYVAGFMTGSDGQSGLVFSRTNMYILNDYNQLFSTLEHEAYHYNNGSGIVSGARAEDGAYKQQVSGSFFAGASTEYKRLTAESWYEEVKGLGDYSGSTLSDFYEMCGLNRRGK